MSATGGRPADDRDMQMKWPLEEEEEEEEDDDDDEKEEERRSQ